MVAGFLAAQAARADDCQEDLALQAAVDDEVKGLDIWSWTWGSIYAAAAVVQTGLAIGLRDDAARIDLSIGAISAAVGSASLFLLPLRFTLPLRRARDCATLEKVASEEGVGKSWLGHLGTVLFNVAIFIVEGVGFHHWEAGLIGGGVGLAVGELNLWTQPTQLENKLGRHVRVVPVIGHANGVSLVIDF